jgi:hypothetical protein
MTDHEKHDLQTVMAMNKKKHYLISKSLLTHSKKTIEKMFLRIDFSEDSDFLDIFFIKHTIFIR